MSKKDREEEMKKCQELLGKGYSLKEVSKMTGINYDTIIKRMKETKTFFPKTLLDEWDAVCQKFKKKKAL